MATVIHELNDCVITDTGEVFVDHRYLAINRLLANRSVSGLKVERLSFAERTVSQLLKEVSVRPESDIERYNSRCNPEKVIVVGEIDGVPAAPPPHTFEFNIPEEYFSIDLLEFLAEKLTEMFPNVPQEYVDRLGLEWNMFQERNMEGFLRSLIYMVQTWEEHQVVHGVGRGSACASLILYLIGVHMVDPVEYDIPIREFLR